MWKLTKPIFIKTLRYVGIALLYMPNDLNWYWGNLVSYVDSYNYAYRPDTASQAPWLISLFIASWGIGLMIGAYLNKKLSQFSVAVVGVIVYDIGLTTSYLSVQKSMNLLNFTMGVLCGFGYGLIQAMVYVWVRDTTSTNVAVAFGLVSNCLNLGAMCINEIITLYINPNNLKPTLSVGVTKLFAEESIIERVPSIFLFLGMSVFAFHTIGLSLIRVSFLRVCKANDKMDINKAEDVRISEKHPILRPIGGQKKSAKVGRNECLQGDSETSNNALVSDKEIDQTAEEDDTRYRCCITDINQQDGRKNEIDSKNLESQAHVEEKTQKDLNHAFSYSLKEALKTKTFYALCLALLSADVCYICVLNFYKKFGNLWIHSDHFLVAIGTASSLVVLLMRLLWGAFMDKYGVKWSAIVFISCISLFFLTYFFTPNISEYMFGVWTVFLSTLCTALYLIFPVASLKLFGPTNFSAIYGAVMSTTIVTNIVAPLILEEVLLNLGWYGLFTGIGILNGVVLVVVIMVLPPQEQ